MKKEMMKTVTEGESVRCVLCGGNIAHELDYLIWEEKESRFWLCQKCSYLLAGEPANTEIPDHPLHPHQN